MATPGELKALEEQVTGEADKTKQRKKLKAAS